MIMSLLNEVQKFIEAHPGCTSGDIADAFAGYSRQRVLQSASKLRQSGRVAHRCEGDTRRHFPRLTERAQEPEPQPVRETRPARNFYVGTNDPRVILCLTRQAEELESRGLYRRAATVWMAAFRESHSQPERNNFLARRERAAGRKFQSAACAAIVEQLRRLPKPTSAPASVEIVLFPPDNRIRDLDNYNKALFDVLTHAGVWEDDSQVKRMLVEWGPVIPEGKVEITISKYEKTAGADA
ncbi:TPA: RusA family crossover junction endodeoxyribonuclease [Escherichia coli]|nr:RusA family crossover junction endodeoxyribonuclease [Escherichia coli]